MTVSVRKGDAVRQILPAPIEGVVESFSICQETGKPQVMVTTTNAAGDKESRFFDVDAVELITPANPA